MYSSSIEHTFGLLKVNRKKIGMKNEITTNHWDGDFLVLAVN